MFGVSLIVLSICQMPLRNGPDTAKELREMGFVIPIIGITGKVRQDELDSFLASGADAVITKPFSVDKLFEVIHDIKDFAQPDADIRKGSALL